LEIREDQKKDDTLLEAAKKVLIEQVEYTENQAMLAIDFAKRAGKCLIFEGSAAEVGSITAHLANYMIGASIENKSLK